ncbi:hypothetical protein DAPPUDRAFT_240816 [Daphnia pulex]|uniref:C1q domain-containing protein n=1 Tax=Daphnia pulex TaxID=6669 RepID=E9GCM9_DAPPU|nr:hypothetical protein DAPPUDRAFT_240816 [Daphnia pulex]|eukprot:EFX82585.1 hypothetical protein DAPPUDRAFT_240816 [Daphnia pulex]
MKSDLTNKFDGSKKELEETKINLEETRVNVKNLSTQLNGTKKELGKTKIDLEETRINVKNLSTQLNEKEMKSKYIFINLATKKELAETKITAGNFSTGLKETKQDLLKTRTDLTKKDDDLSTKLKATEKELAELKTTTGNLSTEFDRTKKELGETKIDLEETRANVKNLSTQLNATEKQLAETKITAGNLSTELKETKQDLLKTRSDLTNKDDDLSTKMKEKQKWIGYADVKSAPVHFYVQRNSSFNTKSTPLPFDLVRVNEGNAMNLTSGIFTAPRPGIYFFSFAGLARLSSSSSSVSFSSYLYLNGNRIGMSHVEVRNTTVNQWSPLTLQSTLDLKKDDQLWVQISYSDNSSSYLYDNIFHQTHFTGFMLEEEIVASL